MALGLIGRKCGMTRIFTESGESIPVTVVSVAPNHVVQVKTLESDGYNALQVGAGVAKPQRLTKAELGHFAKATVEPATSLREFRVNEGHEHKIGDELTVELFQAGQKVDVSGVSKGKGFQGGIKRHNFTMQDATHGNSVSHRAIGSTGQNQTPGRVFKGKKMPGQMGNKNRTAPMLEVVKIDVERRLLLIKGAVPGFAGGEVVVTPAAKAKEVNNAA
ncbi:MAG: 50S ribosomal protein L3 [Gammaproteobacteria bacterium CG11_big_fil_rev_8_21_14_0_20_46_22]|nr:MAG: 50S ribosomal protein L3 [Gammaproteobacteria bacterium CG12_big_fil_rev_8_21_14_0_65_46_12]PIR11307.1 MAG: 50S ribosomal protein L3 [Gammaproteobacteria bacterium CG11_big_fil_rev_8_21_14_0_20_46_22]